MIGKTNAMAKASGEDKVIDLSMQDVYGNPIRQTTANCYVVTKPGVYKFPLVFGNAITNGEVNSAAFTNNGGTNSRDFVDRNNTIISTPFIEQNIELAGYDEDKIFGAEISNYDTEEVFAGVGIIGGEECKYMQVEISSVPSEGANGVISVVNGYRESLWSWHIWVWPHDLTPVEITNSTGVKYGIMPVNLATKLDYGTVYGSGTSGYKNWFYQFGRPTPMLLPASYSSTSRHEIGRFAINGAAYYCDSFVEPYTFFKEDTNGNWFKDYPSQSYNMWDAACTAKGNSDNDVVKTVYDPCPVGWKMPNGNVFTGFSIDNVVGSFSNGWKFKRYSGDTKGVFFPAAGRITSAGSVSLVGSNVGVWLSSAYSTTRVYMLQATSSKVQTQTTAARAYGFSVRPVQD